MNVNVEIVCGRVVDALLNGGYQGLLLTGLIFAGLRCLGRSSAATRHDICFVTLLLVALLPAAHLARSTSHSHRLFSEPVNAGFAESHISPLQEQSSEQLFADSRGIASTRTIPSDNALPPEAILSYLDLPESSAESVSISESFGGNPDLSNLALPFHLSPRTCVALIFGCAALAFIRLGALVWQWSALLLLKRRATKADSRSQDQFQRICADMKWRRAPRLLLVGEGAGPCAVGFLRPAVLAPPSLLEGEAERAEPILRHELAHLARGDDWWSLVQQVIAALFFFHPAVWMLSRRLQVEREIACDDQVLAARPDRLDYALVLTDFASQSAASRWSAAPAGWGSKSQLKRRIDMILDKHRNASPRAARASVGLVSAAALLAAILALGFAPQLAFAQPSQASDLANDEVEIEEAESEDRAVELRAPNGAVLSVPALRPIPPLAALGVPEPPASPDRAAPPRPPRPARVIQNTDAVEGRLERLENILEELLAQKTEPKSKAVPFAWDGDAEFRFDDKALGRVQKDMERAAKDAERVARKMRDAHEHSAKHSIHMEFETAGPIKAQRKALEAQRKALEKQLQALEQRLDALEREEEQAAERPGRPNKNQSNDSNEDSDDSERPAP